MPYTIQFGTRAHYVDDVNAELARAALAKGDRTVDLEAFLAGPESPAYKLTLAVAHIVAIIEHQQAGKREDVPSAERSSDGDETNFSVILQERSYCVARSERAQLLAAQRAGVKSYRLHTIDGEVVEVNTDHVKAIIEHEKPVPPHAAGADVVNLDERRAR